MPRNQTPPSRFIATQTLNGIVAAAPQTLPIL